MKYKHKFEMKYLGYFTSEELSLKTISTYFNKTVGKGDYYKLDKARENSNYSEDSFNRYINKIRALNINAVTIPRAWKLDSLKQIDIYKDRV